MGTCCLQRPELSVLTDVFGEFFKIKLCLRWSVIAIFAKFQEIHKTITSHIAYVRMQGIEVISIYTCQSHFRNVQQPF